MWHFDLFPSCGWFASSVLTKKLPQPETTSSIKFEQKVFNKFLITKVPRKREKYFSSLGRTSQTQAK